MHNTIITIAFWLSLFLPHVTAIAQEKEAATAALLGRLEAPDGTPMANAVVMATCVDTPDFGVKRTTTDKDGKYRFEGLQYGMYALAVWPATVEARKMLGSVVYRRVSVAQATLQFDIRLQRRAPVQVVVTQDGAPLKDVVVYLASVGDGRSLPGVRDEGATTDSSGSCTLLAEPGDYMLTCRRDSVQVSGQTITVDADGAKAALDVGSIRVPIELRDDDGRAVTRCTLRAFMTGGDRYTVEQRIEAGGGVVEMPALRPGVYLMEAAVDGRRAYAEDVVVERGKRTTVSLRLPRSGVIIVKVTSPTGGARSGLRILVRHVSGVPKWLLGTDREGTVRQNVAPGEWQVGLVSDALGRRWDGEPKTVRVDGGESVEVRIESAK